MARSLRAICLTSTDSTEVMPFELADLTDGHVIIRTLVSAISPGTELRCFAGKQPGAPDFPFVPGYARMGIVEEAAGDCSEWRGRKVVVNGALPISLNTCWGGHVSHQVVPVTGMIEIPEGVPDEFAAMARMVGIAHRGVVQSSPNPGDKVAVVGLGLIGQLAARQFAAAGCQVVALDLSENRRRAAIAAGISAIAPEPSIAAAVSGHFGSGADIVVDSTGSPKVTTAALEAMRDEPWNSPELRPTGPKFVIQGSYPDDVTFDYMVAFRREAQIFVPRDTTKADIVRSLQLIAEGKLDMRGLIARELSPERATDAYLQLRDRPNEGITNVFRWSLE